MFRSVRITSAGKAEITTALDEASKQVKFGKESLVVVGFGFQSISAGMDWLSHLVLGAGNVGLFAYGVLNRLLIVTGLHQQSARD